VSTFSGKGYLAGLDKFSLAEGRTMSSMLVGLDASGHFLPGWSVDDDPYPPRIPYSGCRYGATLAMAYFSALNIPSGFFYSNTVSMGQPKYSFGTVTHAGLCAGSRLIRHADSAFGRLCSGRYAGVPISLLNDLRASARWKGYAAGECPHAGAIPEKGVDDSPDLWRTRILDIHALEGLLVLSAWYDSGDTEAVYGSEETRTKAWIGDWGSRTWSLWGRYSCNGALHWWGPWGVWLSTPALGSSSPDGLTRILSALKTLIEQGKHGMETVIDKAKLVSVYCDSSDWSPIPDPYVTYPPRTK